MSYTMCHYQFWKRKNNSNISKYRMHWKKSNRTMPTMKDDWLTLSNVPFCPFWYVPNFLGKLYLDPIKELMNWEGPDKAISNSGTLWYHIVSAGSILGVRKLCLILRINWCLIIRIKEKTKNEKNNFIGSCFD